MSESDNGPLLERAREIMVQWLLERGEGKSPDLNLLCGGDPKLQDLTQRLIERDQAFFSDSDAALRKNKQELDRRLSALGLKDDVLGDFRLLSIVGRGGMGTVFSARQESLGRMVALKVLDAGFLPDNHARLRFRREAEVAASLEHSSIVPVFAVGEASDRVFIAMKLLAGPGLDQLARPVNPQQVAEIGTAIANALEAAHGAGIVHRDVKPANILLDEERPYLVDFGLARGQSDVTLTKSRNVPGTLPYMPPEQLATERPPLDPRQDVYALGATLYELLCGHPPFQSKTVPGLIHKILLTDAPALKLPAAHRDLETIVMRCLEKEPAKRISSARRLALELNRYLEGRPIEARPSSMIERAWRMAKRNRLLASSAAAFLIILSVLSFLFVRSHQREQKNMTLRMTGIEKVLNDQLVTDALTQLASLQADYPNNSEIETFSQRVRQRASVEQLLDAAMNGPTAGIAAEYDSAVRMFLETDQASGRPKVGSLALALCHWLLGNSDAVLEVIESADLFEHPIAKGIHELNLGLIPPAELSIEIAKEVEPDLLVLGCAVLRYGGYAVEDCLPLARKARNLDPGHVRARLLEAMLYFDDLRIADAELALSGLAHAAPKNRGVVRGRIHCALLQGDFDEAEKLLSSMPKSRWSPIEARMEMQLLFSLGRLEELDQQLQTHLRRAETPEWSRGASTIRWFEAELLMMQGSIEEALLKMSGLLTKEATPTQEQIGAQHFRIAVEQARTSIEAEINPQKALEPLLANGIRLADSTRNRQARGTVIAATGILQLRLGQTGVGFASLERAISLKPEDVGLLIEYLSQLIPFRAAYPQLVWKNLLVQMGHLRSNILIALPPGKIYSTPLPLARTLLQKIEPVLPEAEALTFPRGLSQYLLVRAWSLSKEAIRLDKQNGSNWLPQQRNQLYELHLIVSHELGAWQSSLAASEELFRSSKNPAFGAVSEDLRKRLEQTYGRTP